MKNNNNTEIENDIKNKLDIFKNNNLKLDIKFNDDILSLEEEKKYLKEIKSISDYNIQIIKSLKENLFLQKGDNKTIKLTSTCSTLLLNEFINYLEFSKLLIKQFYKTQNYYKEKLSLKMFQQYRTIKADLKDEEILKALQDSSPDQIFFKTSFGFSGFNEKAKSALVYIQYRHHDLKILNLTIEEIQQVSKEFNINWDLTVESSSYTTRKYRNYEINNQNNINNNSSVNNNYNSPTFLSSITLGSNNNQNNMKEQEVKESVQYIKKQLRSTAGSRRFLIFNIWCCGE